MTTTDAPFNAPAKSPSLPSETYTRSVLPPVLNTFDLLAIFILAIFYIANSAVAASGGAVSFIYWLIGVIAFFLPGILATVQLSVIYPHEGSMYHWTCKVLGPHWGFFVGACWWLPSPMIVMSSGVSIVTFIQGLNSEWLVHSWQQGLFIIAIVILSGIVASQRTRTMQNILNICAVLIFVVVALLGISVVTWLISGRPSVASFVQADDWRMSMDHLGLLSLIILALLGPQVSMNMAGEVSQDRRGGISQKIKQHQVIGLLLIPIGYFIATLALLVVQGPENGATPFALIATVDAVLGKFAGNIVALCIMTCYVGSAIMYNASFARILFAGAADQRLPLSVGLLNRHRAPANAVIFQTSIAVVAAAVFFLLAPLVAPYISSVKPMDLAFAFYNVTMAFVTVVWGVMTIFLFVDLFMAYRNDRSNFIRHRLFPMPLIWTTIIIGPIGACVGIFGALRYSWMPSVLPDQGWFLIVSGIVFVCFVLAGVGSMMATSEAAWQRLRE